MFSVKQHPPLGVFSVKIRMGEGISVPFGPHGHIWQLRKKGKEFSVKKSQQKHFWSNIATISGFLVPPWSYQGGFRFYKSHLRGFRSRMYYWSSLLNKCQKKWNWSTISTPKWSFRLIIPPMEFSVNILVPTMGISVLNTQWKVFSAQNWY